MPAMAQEKASLASISAKEPRSIMGALALAGYEAKQSTDSDGDPLIELELAGMPTQILFYGCDTGTGSNCDSIRLSTGFDRKSPWNAAEALQVSTKYRFASVSLDDEGDPYIAWDIMTGDGIPTPVFLKSLRYFENTVSDTSDLVFAEENAETEKATDAESSEEAKSTS
jgi:hypothetical protein